MAAKLRCLGICLIFVVRAGFAENDHEPQKLSQNMSATLMEARFVAWYDLYDEAQQTGNYKQVAADWAYQTNITDENEARMVAATAANADFLKQKSKEMKALFPNAKFTSERNRRLYNKLKKVGDAALSASDFKVLLELKSKMESVYATAKVCHNRTITNITQCPVANTLRMEPELTRLMDTSRDYDELLHLWKAWRDATGQRMREDYKQYIDLKNKAARADGYADNAVAWRSPYVEPDFNYTDADFLAEIHAIWETIRPLYKELHAYVRNKLIQQYGADKVTPRGPIPAHLLGNMWSQSWLSLLNFTVPFKSKPPLDVSAEMKKQNWTSLKLFQTADTFFEDLGLIKMPPKFWKESIFDKPTDREMVCHPSAWDFFNGSDFRIKQCTTISMVDLLTIHHEMGHIEYFLQYKDQPVTFRDGANDGFHEAIGDTLALSVSTPKHLEKLGLLVGHNASDTEVDINFMYATALEKIAFLPFGLTMDMYRYDVFSGLIGKHELNAKWWEYVVRYQGMCAPVARSEEDCDPASKYHVPADVPYMRYFVSFILQFQFHEAMCRASGHTGPLYTCDIDGSKAAGKLLADGLALGSSKPWQYAMERLTGQTKMDARPLIAFFEPLHRYLEAENKRTGAVVGWTQDVHCPTGATSASTAQVLSIILLFSSLMLQFVA